MPPLPSLRRAVPAVLAAVAALALAGCLSIKSQSAFQRTPGVVQLGGVICASDYDQSEGSACRAGNVAEPHENANDATAGFGQLLVGFRIPAGAAAPGTFQSESGNLGFSRREEYAASLQKAFPAPAGQRWEGYVSTPKDFKPETATDGSVAFHPEFTLPAGAGGAPFAGPLPWRMVVGFRKLANDGEAGTPVACFPGSLTEPCTDSPPSAAIPADLLAPVSDFGVLAPPPATAAQTTTATVAFPLAYQDGGGLGGVDVALSATTDVPGAAALPSAPSVRMEPGTRSVDVRVPVALGTPPGTYAVTLTAATGSPAVTRTATGVLVVTGPPDTDGDGVADPADRCPAAGRGRFDADADGCVGPYARIVASPSGTWAVSAQGVRIGRMRLKGVPAGARVRVSGRVRQSLDGTGAPLELKRLRGKLLPRGKGFTATVTAPGRIGQRIALRVKPFRNSAREFKRIARAPFTRARRCIPVGAVRPARECDATPPAGP